MESKIVDMIISSIDRLDEKIDKVDDKVSAVLAFKWQIVGGSLVVSLLVGIAIQVLLNFYK